MKEVSNGKKQIDEQKVEKVEKIKKKQNGRKQNLQYRRGIEEKIRS